MRRSALTLAPTLTVVLALGGLAPAHAVDMGHITGTVTDGDGMPLAGIYVEVYAWDGSQTTFENTTTTGADGTYDVGDLPDATYRVRFADYSEDAVYPTEWWEDALDSTTADDVVVGVDETVPDIDAVMEPGGKITGRVTSGAGTPRPGITVEPFRRSGDDWELGTSMVTDAQGDYSLDALIPGTYRLKFIDYAENDWTEEYWDDAATLDLGTDIVVESEGNATADAVLTNRASVEGVVTEPGGSPIPGVNVVLYDDGSQIANAVTDADGSYRLLELEAGTYRVGFTDPTGDHLPEFFDDAAALATSDPVLVPARTFVTGVDAELAVAPVRNLTAPTVSGTARVGATLTFSPGTWDPADAAITRQWYVGATPAPGATGLTFVPRPADVGKRVSVLVGASDPDRIAVQVATAATAPVARGTITCTRAPSLKKTAKKLTVVAACRAPGLKVTYRWKAPKGVKASTSKTQKVAKGTKASQYRVTVTLAAPGYATKKSTLRG